MCIATVITMALLFADIIARTVRVLLLMVIPGHLLFVYTIHFLEAGHTPIGPLFLTVYLSAAFIQVK